MIFKLGGFGFKFTLETSLSLSASCNICRTFTPALMSLHTSPNTMKQQPKKSRFWLWFPNQAVEICYPFLIPKKIGKMRISRYKYKMHLLALAWNRWQWPRKGARERRKKTKKKNTLGSPRNARKKACWGARIWARNARKNDAEEHEKCTTKARTLRSMRNTRKKHAEKHGSFLEKTDFWVTPFGGVN